jgi:hypothetical protein
LADHFPLVVSEVEINGAVLDVGDGVVVGGLDVVGVNRASRGAVTSETWIGRQAVFVLKAMLKIGL